MEPGTLIGILPWKSLRKVGTCYMMIHVWIWDRKDIECRTHKNNGDVHLFSLRTNGIAHFIGVVIETSGNDY